MPKLILENFKYGLDARRSELTSVLGTLQTLKNAHINQGGEIEQRKSFVAVDITPSVLSQVSATFGIEALASTIVIFGGDENMDVVNWPPTGYTYQRLIRWPAQNAESSGCSINTPNYCASCEGFSSLAKATNVLYSNSIRGKTFAIALMSDGVVNCFYDAVVVPDINYFGRILPDENSLAKMYCAMVMMINETEDYTADLADDLGSVTVTGPTGRDFTTRFSVSGSLCSGVPDTQFVSAPTPTIAGKTASGYFQIQGGQTRSGVEQITQVKVGTTNLLAAAVNYITDPTTTAAAVAAAINTNTDTSGYNAVNVGNRVFVYANATGTTANNKNITVTVIGHVIIPRCFLKFSGSTFTLTGLLVNGKTILTAFNGVFPTAAETLAAFVGRIADNITVNSGTNGGYIALAQDNILKIGKLTTQSNVAATVDDANPVSSALPVQVDWTGTATIVDATDTSANALTVTASPVSVVLPIDGVYNFTKAGLIFSPAYVSFSSRDPIVGFVVGGIPPYVYNWRVVDQLDCVLDFEHPQSLTSRVIDLNPISTPISIGELKARVLARQATVVLDVFDSNGEKSSSNPVLVKFSM